MKTYKEIAMEFAKAWNIRDSKYIEPLLKDDFRYSSQWVLTDIENKNDFLKYFDGKLKTIKQTKAIVFAEVGEYNNKYYLVISQILNGKINKVTLSINVEEGMIKSANMGLFPAPGNIKTLWVK